MSENLTNRITKLKDALEYWLPPELPLSYGVGNIIEAHHKKWHEAKALLSSEYSDIKEEK